MNRKQWILLGLFFIVWGTIEMLLFDWPLLMSTSMVWGTTETIAPSTWYTLIFHAIQKNIINLLFPLGVLFLILGYLEKKK